MSVEQRAAFAEFAYHYAELGWPLVRLEGKRPKDPDWQKSTADEPGFAAGKWSSWGDRYNLGTVLGDERCVFEYDADDAKARFLELLGGTLPATPVCRTGSGKWHVYFAANGVTRKAARDGLELRVGAHQCVVPPSVHPDTGQPYVWLAGHEPWAVPLLELPAAVLDYFAVEKRRNGAAPAIGDVIPLRERNDTLASLAGSMRRRGMGEEAIAAALLEENKRCAEPLVEAEVRGIAASVARYEPEEAEGAPGKLEPLDLDELLAGPLPEIPWRWHKWLARSELALAVADPKTGKSLLSLGLAAAILRGEPFLGEPCERGRVGIFDYENPLEEVQRRLRAFGVDAASHDGLTYWHMPPLDLQAASAGVVLAELVASYELDLLVIDSARRAAPGLDENDSQSVSRVFSPLRRVSAESGAVLLVVHHARKRFGDNPSEAGQMVRGSGDLVASVDTLLYLRAKEPGAFTLETVSRRGLPHEPILVRIEEDEEERLRLVNEGAVAMAEDKVEALLAKIIAALHADGGALERPIIALRVGADTRNSTFQRALNLGWQRGQLAKSERKVGEKMTYSIAPGVLE